MPHTVDQLEDKPKPPMKVGENHFHVSSNYIEPDMCMVEVTSKEDQDPKRYANEKVDFDSNIFMPVVVFIKYENIDLTIKKFEKEISSRIYPKAENTLLEFLQRNCSSNQEVILLQRCSSVFYEADAKSFEKIQCEDQICEAKNHRKYRRMGR